MKKQLIIGTLSFIAILFVGTKAQAQTTNTDDVGTTAEVKIELTKFSSINEESGIFGTDHNINFEYNTPAAYVTDQGEKRDDHLIITAAEAFSVKVKATGDGAGNFNGGSTNSKIKLDVLTIEASAASVNGGDGTMDPIQLSETSNTLIDGATYGALKTYDVKYSISAAKAEAELLGKDTGDYTATVTYSFTHP